MTLLNFREMTIGKGFKYMLKINYSSAKWTKVTNAPTISVADQDSDNL